MRIFKIKKTHNFAFLRVENPVSDQVMKEGYGKTSNQTSVNNRLLGEFPKLEKLLISHFESRKPFLVVKENEKIIELLNLKRP